MSKPQPLVCPPIDPCAAIRTQPDWFIDPIGGNDANDGRTAATALATFAELQARLGDFTVLCPTGSVLRISILNDLPDSDPVTFRNLFCTGSTGVIFGAPEVLATGTVDAITVKDRAANIPYQLASAGIDWSQYIGFMVRIVETGVRAYVARDYGGGLAQMSEWVEESGRGFLPELVRDLTVDPISQAAPPPEPGQTFEILDFSSFVISDLTTGYDNADDVLDTGVPGGLILHNVHIRVPPHESNASFPYVLGSMQTLSAIHDSIADAEMAMPPGSQNTIAGNVSFRRGLTSYASFGTVTDGLFRPVEGFGSGGLRVEVSASMALTGDVTFIGHLPSGAFADLAVLGHVFTGPISFWDTLHAFVIFEGGEVFVEPFSPIFGESCFVPFWGDGNVGTFVFFPGGKITLDQFCFGADAPPLPSLVMQHGPGGPVANLRFCPDTTPADLTAHAWQRAIAQFTPPILVTWANFEVPAPAGFLLEAQTVSFPDGDFTFRCAIATDPATGSAISRLSGNFAPAFVAASALSAESQPVDLLERVRKIVPSLRDSHQPRGLTRDYVNR